MGSRIVMLEERSASVAPKSKTLPAGTYASGPGRLAHYTYANLEIALYAHSRTLHDLRHLFYDHLQGWFEPAASGLWARHTSHTVDALGKDRYGPVWSRAGFDLQIGSIVV